MSWFIFTCAKREWFARCNDCCRVTPKRIGQKRTGQQRNAARPSHLRRPARCCPTVCRIWSSPPADCSYSCPLPSQCHASANRRGRRGQDNPANSKNKCKAIATRGVIARTAWTEMIWPCCQDENWKFIPRRRNTSWEFVVCPVRGLKSGPCGAKQEAQMPELTLCP